MEFYGYTSSEFADTVDVPRSSISHITSGRNKPSLDFLMKVKNRFPELLWPWIIDGQGEMTTPKEATQNRTTESPEPAMHTTTPDLFTLSGIEVPNIEWEEKKPTEAKRPESNKPVQDSTKQNLQHSQPLENDSKGQINKKEIKRIVFFFEDGTFETFEN